MSSSSMPPPPTPLSHRRSNRLVNSSSKLFPSSPDLPPCLPRMSLSKGATFHHSSSPPSDDDPILSIHHLARRSPTCSQSMLASWLSDKKDIAQSLADFEETFSGARGRRLSSRRVSAQEFEQQQRKIHRASISSDEGLGGSISAASDKSLSQKFERALDLLEKDSGLGSSIGDNESVRGGRALEDNSTPKDMIKDTNSPAPAARQTRQRQPSTRNAIPSSASAVTQSIAPPTSKKTSKPQSLSSFSKRKINKLIFAPVLQQERFEAFHPLISSLGAKGNKSIRCLRDIEQSLIFQPLSLSVTPNLYRAFGEFSIQLVVDTYQQIPETEQRRAADRPYDNGYFLDLVQQVGRLAAQIGPSTQSSDSAEEDDDELAYSPNDEVTLEGGLGSTGTVAELVRWRNGKGISLRTGEMYEPTPGIKREASSMLDDDAARSMARRKKGYIPEIVEMKCSDTTCDKIFTRKCDLAKHEKTHSRPFKCPHATCKYHDMGLPTEKERDRHMNDKHDPNPKFYQCEYCEFRTKRESNCKQHMEKKHGWEYQRAKGKDKGSSKMTPAQTPQTPAIEYTSSKQSPAVSYMSTNWDDGSSVAGSIVGSHSAQLTPYDQAMSAFESFPQNRAYNAPLFPRNDTFQQMDEPNFDFNNWQPGQSYISPVNSHPSMTTPVTPAYSNITGQSPFLRHMDVNMEMNNTAYENNYNSLPTPDSFLQTHSRNPSISHQSPLFEDMKFEDTSNMYDADINFNDPVIGGGMNIPDNDFDLFSGQVPANSAFSNQAAASATLFPASQFAALDNDPILDEAYDEGFVDYNMS